MSDLAYVLLPLPNTSSGIGAWEPIAPNLSGPLEAKLKAELARYPEFLWERFPAFFLASHAEIGGSSVGAAYVAVCDMAVITPRLDFRGNVHRLVAMALLHKFADAAKKLREVWYATSQCEELYGSAFRDDAAIAAVIGAIVGGRTSFRLYASTDALLSARLEGAYEFLGALGADSAWFRDAQPSPPVAFSATIEGQHPNFEIRPGGIPLYLSPPVDENLEHYSYDPLDQADEAGVLAAVRRDIWVMPEDLFAADSVRALHIVADVHVQRDSNFETAGYAWGSVGESHLIVSEYKGHQRILYHEFGHALERRFNATFPTKAWNGQLPPGFKYLESVDAFAKESVGLPDFSVRLVEQGFLTSYSRVSIREDVAEITCYLFLGDERLWSVLPRSARLKAKVALLITFLSSIDPVLTEEYFRLLASERHAVEASWGAM